MQVYHCFNATNVLSYCVLFFKCFKKCMRLTVNHQCRPSLFKDVLSLIIAYLGKFDP